MSTILRFTTVPSALSLVRQSLASHGDRAARHQFWLFTSQQRRRQLEAELAADGWTVRLHSAFKPLISAVLEQREPLLAAAGEGCGVTVTYPLHPAAVDDRFRLEAYPLARLLKLWLPGAALTFQPAPISDAADLNYHVSVGGRPVFSAFAPNRLVNAAGRQALTPSGWWRVTQEGGAVMHDAPWQTPYESLYQLAMDAVAAQPWTGAGPHFKQLRIEVSHDGMCQALPVGHDRLDTAEALHEELYFSLLEQFAAMADLPPGSRALQPGQVVPIVRNSSRHLNSVKIMVTSPGLPVPSLFGGQELSPTELARVGQAPEESDIAATLVALPGKRFEADTPQDRTVYGVWRQGSTPAVVINGGQHANENSGIVGALRAAQALMAQPHANLAVIALENPDGYALHKELCEVQGEQMHHAARYSALGDDLEYRSNELPHESAVRRQLLKESGAQLLINLHGYPAHEWIRPLTGYLPHKFEWWAMPQGFILMARYQKGHGERAERLLRQTAREVQAALPELAAFNRDQLESYRQHAGKLLFPLEGQIPLALSETDKPGPAIQVITEYPDETISGADFRLAHQAQYLTAVSLVRGWWGLGD